MTNTDELNQALAEVFPHLRDVSTRDGVQSWDANKWKIADILPVVGKINELAATVKKELGVDLPPIEAWGGGQFAQPAQFNAEDPFKNLEVIHAIAPDLKIQALVRGRQCLGFKPVSDEIQTAAIKAAADKGVQVFRVFDMMNDMDNVLGSFEAFRNAKATHPDLIVEGAVSYVSEPENGTRAWDLGEYADYALKLARLGANEIAIKNYAGVGDAEMPDLIKTIKQKLYDNGFPEMKVNLHDHGQKPEVLIKALEAGADKVDVAIGELSGGPSHTNMRDVIHAILEKKGFSSEDIDAHPVMQKLEMVETQISNTVHRKDIKFHGSEEPKSFDDARTPLKKITQADMDESRMAAGAVSDLLSRARGLTIVLNGLAKDKSQPIKEDVLFKDMLKDSAELWEKGGRFNLVTPGAKIMVDQIQTLTYKKLSNKPISIADYTKDFKDVVIGRYGLNHGMEKEIGDVKFRDALMMYNAMEVFNKAADERKVSNMNFIDLIKVAGFNSENNRIKVVGGRSKFVLDDPNLESFLKESDIESFKQAIQSEEVKLPEEVKKKMLAELTLGRSATPVTTLENGRKAVEDLGVDVKKMQDEGKRISSPEILGLEACLLDPKTFESMVKQIRDDVNIQIPEGRQGGRAVA